MNLTNLFFYSFSPVFISCLTFIAGFVLICMLRINLSGQLSGFIILLAGLFVIQVPLALFLTLGKTVHIHSLLLFFMLLAYLKYQNNLFVKDFSPPPIRSDFLVLLIINVLFGVIFVCSYLPYFSTQDIVKVFYPDNYFYTSVSEIIKQTGQENVIGNLNFNADFQGGTSPYHYLELYQNIIFSSLTQSNPLFTFLISLPVFFSSVLAFLYSGIIKEVLEDRNYARPLIIISSVLLLFASGFNIIPFDYVEKGWFSVNMINWAPNKVIPIAIFFTLTTYCVYINKYFLAFFSMLILSVSSFVMLPLALCTIFAFSVVLLCLKKITVGECISFVLVSLLLSGTILVFYYFNHIPSGLNVLPFSLSAAFSNFFSDPVFLFRRIAGTNVFLFLDYLLYFFPFVIFSVFYRKSVFTFLRTFPFTNVFILFFIMFQCGISSSWFLEGQPEWLQIQMFTCRVGGSVLIFWLFLFSVKIRLRAFGLLTFIIISVASFNACLSISSRHAYNNNKNNEHVSVPFYEECEKLFGDGKKYRVALLGKPVMNEAYSDAKILFHINHNIRMDYIDEKLFDNYPYRFFDFYHIVLRNDALGQVYQQQINYLKDNNIQYLISDRSVSGGHPLFKHSSFLIRDSLTLMTVRKVIFEE
jgi:hypothetical protein